MEQWLAFTVAYGLGYLTCYMRRPKRRISPLVASVRHLVALPFLLAPALAQAAPIYPPLTAGQYVVHAQQPDVPLDANGVPTAQTAGSLELFDVATDESLHCEVMASGEDKMFSVTVAAVGTRRDLRARAWTGTDCTGEQSAPSVDFLVLLFGGPTAPVLLP